MLYCFSRNEHSVSITLNSVYFSGSIAPSNWISECQQQMYKDIYHSIRLYLSAEERTPMKVIEQRDFHEQDLGTG